MEGLPSNSGAPTPNSDNHSTCSKCDHFDMTRAIVQSDIIFGIPHDGTKDEVTQTHVCSGAHACNGQGGASDCLGCPTFNNRSEQHDVEHAHLTGVVQGSDEFKVNHRITPMIGSLRCINCRCSLEINSCMSELSMYFHQVTPRIPHSGAEMKQVNQSAMRECSLRSILQTTTEKSSVSSTLDVAYIKS